MKIFLSQDLFDFSQITAFPEEQNTLLPLGRKISKNHSFHRRRENSVATWQENSSASCFGFFFQFKKITVFTEEERTVLPLGRKWSWTADFSAAPPAFSFPGNPQIDKYTWHKYTSPHLRKYTGRQVSHDTNTLDRKWSWTASLSTAANAFFLSRYPQIDQWSLCLTVLFSTRDLNVCMLYFRSAHQL